MAALQLAHADTLNNIADEMVAKVRASVVVVSMTNSLIIAKHNSGR